MIKRKCFFCKKEFEVKLSALKRGRGKYCSKKCYSLAQKEDFKNLAKFYEPVIRQIIEKAENINENDGYTEYYDAVTGERGFEKEVLIGGKICWLKKNVRKNERLRS